MPVVEERLLLGVEERARLIGRVGVFGKVARVAITRHQGRRLWRSKLFVVQRGPIEAAEPLVLLDVLGACLEAANAHPLLRVVSVLVAKQPDEQTRQLGRLLWSAVRSVLG